MADVRRRTIVRLEVELDTTEELLDVQRVKRARSQIERLRPVEGRWILEAHPDCITGLVIMGLDSPISWFGDLEKILRMQIITDLSIDPASAIVALETVDVRVIS